MYECGVMAGFRCGEGGSDPSPWSCAFFLLLDSPDSAAVSEGVVVRAAFKHVSVILIHNVMNRPDVPTLSSEELDYATRNIRESRVRGPHLPCYNLSEYTGCPLVWHLIVRPEAF